MEYERRNLIEDKEESRKNNGIDGWKERRRGRWKQVLRESRQIHSRQ